MFPFIVRKNIFPKNVVLIDIDNKTMSHYL